MSANLDGVDLTSLSVVAMIEPEAAEPRSRVSSILAVAGLLPRSESDQPRLVSRANGLEARNEACALKSNEAFVDADEMLVDVLKGFPSSTSPPCLATWFPFTGRPACVSMVLTVGVSASESDPSRLFLAVST